ncbi:hypothetical protein OUZ56_019027 [Daphnia magna]|uniref:deoxyribose-phosphate aldolase n=1 Tax=Daphnia magna TaxID=35525 RepID=A0ABQ9ZAF5_9CRUS|nr:hypothetical protein OUZ56_019027 [Daphnia magna]
MFEKFLNYLEKKLSCLCQTVNDDSSSDEHSERNSDGSRNSSQCDDDSYKENSFKSYSEEESSGEDVVESTGRSGTRSSSYEEYSSKNTGSTHTIGNTEVPSLIEQHKKINSSIESTKKHVKLRVGSSSPRTKQEVQHKSPEFKIKTPKQSSKELEKNSPKRERTKGDRNLKKPQTMKDKNVKQEDDKKLDTTKQDKETTDEKASRLRKSSLKEHKNGTHKMLERNSGIPLNLGWVNRSCVNDQAVKNRVQDLLSSRLIHADHQVEWLARSIQCIDLTTLAGDDCPSNVARLCSKAAHPLSDDLTRALQIKHGLLTTGAVCVYPARVADAVLGLERLGANIPVASVATGFPTGQTSLKIRLEEIEFAVANGAKEIDIVINRELALSQNWGELYNELVEMRKACGESHMKSILAVGELCTLTNIYKASLVAMMAGSDFIKTSTGKETVNATLPIGLVMCRAIRAYNRKTGFKVGFKPAGGIRTSKDVLQWMTLMKEELGDNYLKPDLFRIGASALLNDIERNLANYATGGYFLAEEMPMA